MIDIAHAVEHELAESCLSPETRARLKPCLPMLQDAIGSWQANGGFSAPGIMAVCATPSGATVVHSQRWGDNVDEIDQTTALHVLVRTIDMAATDETARLLIAALSAALGKQGRANPWAEGRAPGRQPGRERVSPHAARIRGGGQRAQAGRGRAHPGGRQRPGSR